MSRSADLFAFDDTFPLAESVAQRLALRVSRIRVHRFPDGESLVSTVSGRAVRAVVFRSLDRPNEKLVELLFAADALRRQGVSEITLVAPYLGYMRQDRVFHRGEPISQIVVARLLGGAFDRVLTVEAHLHRIERLADVFPCDARSVSASSPIARWLRRRTRADVLIGPDAESEPWIRAIAGEADLPYVVAAKRRDSDHDVRVELPTLPKSTRSAWIVDDIVSSGATLEAVTRILRARGLSEVGAVAVHALYDATTSRRLEAAGLDRLVSTDSVTHPSEAISLADLLSESLAPSLEARASA